MTADACANWSTILAEAKLGVTPAELHGSLTGFLCAGWGGRAHELLGALALESAAEDARVDADLQNLLERAAARITARLRAREPAELLLPEGALTLRADAVVDWCRGFLGGLGLTGVVADVAPASETAHLLHDFGQIAAMRLDCEEDDESALDDVLAFIRGGVAHLHAEYAPARGR